MAAPEPGAQDRDLAEKVARAWHEHVAHISWEQATGKDRMIALAEQRLRAFRAAGLVVLALPEPDGWVDACTADGVDTRTPYWRTSWGESVTAWIEGVETPVWELQEDLAAIRDDALKMLAAIATCERYRAENHGGDPR